jgi:hypothetical protein
MNGIEQKIKKTLGTDDNSPSREDDEAEQSHSESEETGGTRHTGAVVVLRGAASGSTVGASSARSTSRSAVGRGAVGRGTVGRRRRRNRLRADKNESKTRACIPVSGTSLQHRGKRAHAWNVDRAAIRAIESCNARAAAGVRNRLTIRDALVGHAGPADVVLLVRVRSGEVLHGHATWVGVRQLERGRVGEHLLRDRESDVRIAGSSHVREVEKSQAADGAGGLIIGSVTGLWICSETEIVKSKKFRPVAGWDRTWSCPG